MATKQKTYTTLRAAAKAWGALVGVHGKQGSTYLYYEDEGVTKQYKPFMNGGRCVQGWFHLGSLLEDEGVLVAVWGEPDTEGERRFKGYRLRG